MKIVKCTCKHSYQDELYGPGNRVANEMPNGQCRCTVCQTIHSTGINIGSSAIKTASEISAAKKAEKKKPGEKKKKKKSLKGGKR